MEHPPIDLTGFKGRAQALEKIQRFKGLVGEPPMFPVMFYRTNDLIHTQRVLWLVEELLPLALQSIPNFDPLYARILALIHDDHETVPNFGDPQLGRRIRMNQQQLDELAQKELQAIYQRAKTWPKEVMGYNYLDALIDYFEKRTSESQFTSFVDKLDGNGKSDHEIWAGNQAFREPAGNYPWMVKEKQEKYSGIRPLFDHQHVLLQPLPVLDLDRIIQEGRPHSRRSLPQPTASPQYDKWRELTIKRGGKKGLKQLTTVLESY